MAVAYDATGGGFTYTYPGSGSNLGISGSWSHTATAGATVIVGTWTQTNNKGHASSFTRSVTYGGVSMTSLGAIDHGGGSGGWTELFYIQNVAGGAKTVAWSTSPVSGSAYLCGAANSVSYTGVGSVNAEVTNDGSGSSASSGSVTSATNNMVVQAFGSTVAAGTNALQSYSGTSRYANGVGVSTFVLDWILGDAPGSTTVTVTASINSTGTPIWSSAAVNLTVGGSLAPASLAGVGTLTVSVSAINPRHVSLTGSGVLSGSESGGAPTRSAALASHGVLAAATVKKAAATATLTGHGVLSAAAHAIQFTLSASSSGAGALTARIGNGFGAALNKLLDGQSITIQTIGDSTVAGHQDGANLNGWVGRIGIYLGVYFNVTVLLQDYTTTSHTYQSAATMHSGAGSNTITILNGGIGATSLADDTSYINSFNLLTVSNPDVIFISTGFNEFINDSYNNTAFVSQYETFVNLVWSHCPNVPIIITTENLIGGGMYGPYATTMQSAFSALTTAFVGENIPLSPPQQASTTTSGVDILDTQAAFNYTYQPALSADGLHPNAAGYAQEASWILSQIAPQVVSWQTPSLTGHGALSATVHQKFASSATLSSRGALVASAGGSLGTAGSVAGVGELTAAVYVKLASASSSQGALSCIAFARFAVAVALRSTGSAAAVVGNPEAQQVSTPLVGAGALSGFADIFAIPTTPAGRITYA